MTFTHSVIHTGGNIYNDYVADFDDSGRVIVVSIGGIFVFSSDRDYQLCLEPEITISCTEVTDDEYPAIQEDSQISKLSCTDEYISVTDLDGSYLRLKLEHNESIAELADWYAKTVGYDPLAEDPNMTGSELRDLVASYREEIG